MSFMLGLVIASLYAIWPFKSFGMVAGRRVDIANIKPANFTMNEGLTVLACVSNVLSLSYYMRSRKRQKAPARCSDTA
jgi:hypothetical protein